MNNPRYTYRLRGAIWSVFSWEIIFWLLMYAVLWLFGFFGNSSNDHLDFKAPERLWLLWFTLPIAVIYMYQLVRTNRLVEQTGANVRKYVFRSVSTTRSFILYFLFRNAFVFLIIALAQPAFGTKKVAGTLESLELVIALDISNSMNAHDIDDDLSRLEVAKRAMVELINNLHGEKIGISVFANSAFPQLPITLDYHAAKMYVQDIQTNMIYSQGTNIKAALETSLDMFSDRTDITKGIILITDGENHEEDPTAILQELSEKQIELAVLGVGTQKGGVIPKDPQHPELGYKKTATGTTVLSKVNPAFIREIATKGNGVYSISDNPFPDLSEVLQKINRMKRTKVAGLEFQVKEDKYQLPLALALFFLVLYSVVSASVFQQVEQKFFRS